LHFCIFERSQGKHNNLDSHNFLEYFPLIAKFTFSKLDTNQICFFMFKALKPWEWTPFLSNVFFFYQMCIILLKIGEDFNIEDYKDKRTWTDENWFYHPFEHIWLKRTFDLQRFLKCGFNKNYSYICDRGHECIIYMISNQFVMKIYLYLKYIVKWGIWDIKF
jgi:hypothetical protein